MSQAAAASKEHPTPASAAKDSGKPKIVVLGSGWAGYSFARHLDYKKFDVHLVSPRNHYLFTPLLPSTTVGTLEFRAIQEPARSIKGVHYYQAEATELDPATKQIKCKEAFTGMEFMVPYDKLVLAMGATTNTFGVPGVDPKNHVYFLKQLTDARMIRNRLVECFERASTPFCSAAEQTRLLSFVIVGGGPTSVEFAAELHDFVRGDAKRLYPDVADKVSVTLVEASHQILGTFDSALVKYTMNLFQKRHVNILTDNSVVGVKDHKVLLADGNSIPYGLVVWSTGIKPVDFTAKLEIEKVRGRITVDERLRVPALEGVYAMGDCAAGKDKALAPLAQVADQQGRYLAAALNRGHEEPFKYVHLGSMAQVGDYQAIVDWHGTRVKHGSLNGLLAWAIWRSAYWTKTVVRC
ncbi:pyridine nucleotide-disulfide oxidoreductase-domain-containing protein [Tribonema minus]|uniref:NADH:ubiquinone reductase (non-electrogenic) n=1 Tax=Tribonema minus TaxID=303371 RepID=A0A835ZFC4_9STRA|nr:pyridine nucleotide-disulfide oxidoreductase-domain-containing protein [Tribonema minus]